MKAVYVIISTICSTVLGGLPPSFFAPTLTPANPKLCTTQDVTFTYKPTDPVDLGDVQLNGISDVVYDELNIRRSENTSEGLVSFMIPNVTMDLYNVNLYCSSGNGSIKSNYVLVKVYEIPKAVENFTCKVFNYVHSMNCSWDVAVDYNWKAQYFLQWRIPTFSSSWNICSELSSSYCFWDKTSGAGDFSGKTVEIQLMLENKPCNSKVVQNYTYNTRRIVQPAPVIGLNGFVINSTCINITWSTDLPARLKIHRLLYHSRWNNSQEVNLTDRHTERNRNITLCDLHPATDYTVVVMVMPTQGGYWSEPRSIKLQTMDDFPSSSPVVVPWTFNLGTRVCDASTLRRVTIHWLPLPEIHHNGRLLSYVVTSMVVDNGEISVNEAPGDRLQLIMYLRCDETYTVSVQPRNGVGKSFMNTTIIVPSVNDVPPQPEFIMEMENKTSAEGLTNITLTLKDQGQKHGPFNYTVLWCNEGSPGYCAGDTSLEWRTFLAAASPFNVEVSTPESLLLGVSMDTEAGRSEVTWKSCLYTKFAEPSKEPRSVSVRKGSEDNTLVVTWDKIQCESGQPYIQKYVVIYCKAAEKDHCSGIKEFGADVSRAELTDLEAEVTYKVAVQGIANSGEAGPLSEYITGVPVDNSLKAGAIAGISTGGLFGFVFIIAGFVSVYRYCKKTAKKQLAPPPIADMLPDTLIDDEFSSPFTITRYDAFQSAPTPFERQWSTDSGVPSSKTSTKSDSLKEQLGTADESDYVVVDNTGTITNPRSVRNLGLKAVGTNDLTIPSSRESHSDQITYSETPVNTSVRDNPVSGYVHAEQLMATGISRKSTGSEPSTGDDKGKHADDELEHHGKPTSGSIQNQSVKQPPKLQPTDASGSSKSKDISRNNHGSNEAVQIDANVETPSSKYSLHDSLNNTIAPHTRASGLILVPTCPVTNRQIISDLTIDRHPSEGDDFRYSESSSDDWSNDSPQPTPTGYVSQGHMVDSIDQQPIIPDSGDSPGIRSAIHAIDSVLTRHQNLQSPGIIILDTLRRTDENIPFEAAKSEGIPNEEQIARAKRTLPDNGDLAPSSSEKHINDLPNDGYISDTSSVHKSAQELPYYVHATGPSALHNPEQEIDVHVPATLHNPARELDGCVTAATALQGPGQELPKNGQVTDPMTLQKHSIDLPNNGYVTVPTAIQKPAASELTMDGYVTAATALQRPGQEPPKNGPITDPTTLKIHVPVSDFPNNGYVTVPTTLQKPATRELKIDGYETYPTTLNEGYVTSLTALQPHARELSIDGYVTDATTEQTPTQELLNTGYLTDHATSQVPGQEVPSNGYIIEHKLFQKHDQGLHNDVYVAAPTTIQKPAQELPNNDTVTDPTPLSKHAQFLPDTGYVTDPSTLQTRSDDSTDMVNNATDKRALKNGVPSANHPPVLSERYDGNSNPTERTENVRNDYVTADHMSYLHRMTTGKTKCPDNTPAIQGIQNLSSGYVTETHMSILSNSQNDQIENQPVADSIHVTGV